MFGEGRGEKNAHRNARRHRRRRERKRAEKGGRRRGGGEGEGEAWGGYPPVRRVFHVEHPRGYTGFPGAGAGVAKEGGAGKAVIPPPVGVPV